MIKNITPEKERLIAMLLIVVIVLVLGIHAGIINNAHSVKTICHTRAGDPYECVLKFIPLWHIIVLFIVGNLNPLLVMHSWKREEAKKRETNN